MNPNPQSTLTGVVVTRWGIPIVAAAYVVYFFSTANVDFNKVASIKIENTTFNELFIVGIQARLDTARTYLQIGLLLFGVVWGYVITKPSNSWLPFADWPERVMFVVANVAFATSFFYHSWYLGEVAHACYDAGQIPGRNVPDLFGARLDIYYVYQIHFFWTGLILTALTFVMAYMAGKFGTSSVG